MQTADCKPLPTPCQTCCRGEDKAKTEFGAKIDISEVNGFCRIGHFSWEAYNEGGDVRLRVEKPE